MPRWLILLWCLTVSSLGDFDLERGQKQPVRIVIPNPCPTPTRTAASELDQVLKVMFDVPVEIVQEQKPTSEPTIFIGASQAAKQHFKNLDFARLASEEILMQSQGPHLLLAGGGPRGDLYAVFRFLQDQVGVRWWTPWAAEVPKKKKVTLSNLQFRYRPPFEYRQPFLRPAFDDRWAVRNQCNGEFKPGIPEEWGGCVRYQGFVHTFYSLIPPEKYFKEHPEWFSLVKGQRTFERAQLCLTHPGLRKTMIIQARQWLAQRPEANIISISQNDWDGACECDSCRQVEVREKSPMGPLLEFVNHVAEALEPDFPSIRVDTLAYQYSRSAPVSLRPRRNVIIRFCADPANRRELYNHPSNQSVERDLEAWGKITENIYVWDYSANYTHYLQPHPNWFLLGPHLKGFHAMKVKGVFSQGVDETYGAELAELRSWLLAQLMWNPNQDDRSLIREFLAGYYGPLAAPAIERYLELMHGASKNYPLNTYAPVDAPFLSYAPLAQAEDLWKQAQKAATGHPDWTSRIEMARLSLRYVWIRQWDSLREQSKKSSIGWPLEETRDAAISEWLRVCAGHPGQPWTTVSAPGPGATPADVLTGKNLKN